MLTYRADDHMGMAAQMEHVIVNRPQVVEAMGTLDVPNTLADEIALLTVAVS